MTLRSLTRGDLLGYGVGQIGGQIYRDVPRQHLWHRFEVVN